MLTLLLRRPHRYVSTRTLIDLSSITPVRDRALDHAVEKEHNLIPLLSLKKLLKSSPSNSLPLSLIKNDPSVCYASRPIEFVRKYPAVFEEVFPIAAAIDPHVKLTPEILALDEEENMVLNSQTNLLESADRVLKLLMMADSKRIPLPVIERLVFDLGLPPDFTESLIPNFPDYFRVSNDELELVCRNGDLAVSAIEKKAKNYEKGMPVEFPMKFSRGFEIEKKFQKWVDEWQKLPYVSPYENAMHLSAKSDEGDKWVVAVLHEVLSLLYSKKTDRENLLFLGECLGLRTRFKQALLHHPGIFYISRKVGSHTVVLRDGYKRDLLVERHPLMDMRYKYIHLMNTVKEDKKQKVVVSEGSKKKKPVLDMKGEEGKKVDGEDGTADQISGSEVDGESEDDFTDDDDHEDEDEDEEDESENENKSSLQADGRGNRGRTRENRRFEGKRALRTSGESSFNGSNRSRTRNYEDKDEDENENEGRRFSRGNRGRTRDNPRFEGKRAEFGQDRSNQRRSRNDETNNDDEGRKFSNNYSRGNGGRTRDNSRYEGKRVEFGRDGADQRRTRNYEGKDGGEDRTYSHMNRSNRGRTRGSPRFEGNRDFRSSDENGRDGSYQRRTRNYEDKDGDRGRTYSPTNRGNRGNTRDNPRFEGKRDFKSSEQSGRDRTYQRRTGNYDDEGQRRTWKREGGEDSRREGFNGKRNDHGRSKESGYKESSRSGPTAGPLL